ncbi:hypothetical protein CRUP_026882, partial [Coryphaenoides rupestris]
MFDSIPDQWFHLLHMIVFLVISISGRCIRPTLIVAECGRSYGRMVELKMHQRYHTGDKAH